MTHQLINSNIADRLLSALCNTLLHSLWQGIILAALAGLIIICTRKATSALRYNLLIAALVFFAAGVSATFVWQYQKSGGTVVAQHISQPFQANNRFVIDNNSVTPAVSAMPAPPVSFKDRISGFLNDHHDTIVLIWFLIICARSLQLAFGLYGTYRLRRVRVFAADKHWILRLQQLADSLNIKQIVTLLESGLAKVPMVIGHLKPVILVPVGLLTALSAEEVEAILVHELAHIKRRDYLVNMLQSLMEIVLFFNPAVLWVSKLVKTERENCCDDLAVAQNNNKLSYIRALLSCQQYQSSVPAYAMAFPGGKSSLLDRVKRMANNRNYSLNLVEKTILAICLVVLGLGASAFTARKDIQKAVKSIVAAIHHDAKAEHKAAVGDTTKKGQAAATNNVSGLPNQVQQLHPDTSKTTGSARLDALVRNVDSLRANSSLGSLPANADTIYPSNKLAFQNAQNIVRELYRERLLTDTNRVNLSLNERELVVNGVRMSEEVHQRIYRQFGRKGERGSYSGNYSGNYTNTYASSYAPVPPTIVVPDFGDTLVKYGIIKDKRHIHAVFNNNELVINGVRQPDDVFQMLYKKYAPNYGDNVNISYTNNGLPDKRMEQNTYWAGQQRKIIDQMQREGLISDRAGLSFTLTDKTFVINGIVQDGDVFERYRHQYVPGNAGDDWVWNYSNGEQNYPAYANGYRDQGAYYQMRADERRRQAEEIDKKLVADLLKDGLITDPNNVSFSFDGKGMTVNGKKQSAELYKKYKDKYRPNTSGSDWSWSYSHHE